MPQVNVTNIYVANWSNSNGEKMLEHLMDFVEISTHISGAT